MTVCGRTFLGLEFFHNKCDIVHGDISINNIVIVRFLPAIVSALQSDFLMSLAGTDVTANAVPPCQPATGGDEAGSVSSSLVDATATAIDGSSQPPLPPTSGAKKFLPSSPESGGSVIDFDCSGATNTLSTGPIVCRSQFSYSMHSLIIYRGQCLTYPLN